MTIPTNMKAVANSQRYDFAGDQPLLGRSRPRARICIQWSLVSGTTQTLFNVSIYMTWNDLGYCLKYILNTRPYTTYICANGGDNTCGLILSTVPLELPCTSDGNGPASG